MVNLFDIQGRVAIITGGSGVLGSAIAQSLAEAGVKVAILGRRQEKAEEVAAALRDAGGEAMACPADVLDADDLDLVRTEVLDAWGRIDILINGAGGNMPGATVGPDENVFDLSIEAFRNVTDLNLTGSVWPTLVFGRQMAEQGNGVVINISSMASERAITRVMGYSAAKAAIDNFTKWMAVELARRYGGGIRVNAIAPGFFVAEQNRALLLNDDGSLTDRGETIIRNTPMGRFGEPEELNGVIHWLCSDAASFVTGIVVPIDGGFSAFSGV